MFHQGLSESLRVWSKVFFMAALLAAPLTVSFAQHSSGMRAGSVDPHQRDPEDPLATMEEEMKAKRAIREIGRASCRERV